MRIAAACLVALLAGCASAILPDDEPVIAIVGASVIDPASEAQPAKSDVLIRGDRVAAVGRRLRIPRSAERIDATGKYLTPGLWDSHAHLNALTNIASSPEIFVGHGVLHVRDMGGELDSLLALRANIESGERTGPTLVIAGPTLNGQKAAPFHRVINDEEEARIAVRELAAVGIDFIKTHRRISRSALTATIDEARLNRLPVFGHVPLGVSWAEGADLGMRSIEHIFTILENELSDPQNPAKSIDDALLRIDGERGERIFATMASAGAALCPTLVAFERTIDEPPDLAAAKRAGLVHFLSYVGRANRLGVPILAGSDVATDPGESLLRELELLVEAGMSPRTVLRAATTNPARLLERPELAEIVEGAPASFLVLDSDPTLNIEALRKIDIAVVRGRVLRRDELQRFRALPAPVESSN